jgi:hypothetical protein
MKLFVPCDNCGGKTYLSALAKTRLELSYMYGTEFNVNCSHCSNLNYLHINQVAAGASSNKTFLSGGGIGGIVGILGGPFGILLGAVVGGAVGGAVGNKSEQDSVRRFNNNYLQ